MKAFVIQLLVPGGNKFAIANESGKFALQLVNGNVYRNCLAWPSEFEATKFLETIRKDEKMNKVFKKYRHEIVAIEVMQ